MSSEMVARNNVLVAQHVYCLSFRKERCTHLTSAQQKIYAQHQAKKWSLEGSMNSLVRMRRHTEAPIKVH